MFNLALCCVCSGRNTIEPKDLKSYVMSPIIPVSIRRPISVYGGAPTLNHLLMASTIEFFSNI